MDVFVYFSGKLDIGIATIEDAINDFLDDRGEVTGSGIGRAGANIDIEIHDIANSMAILDGIRKELKNLGLPEDTILDVDGEQHKLYS